MPAKAIATLTRRTLTRIRTLDFNCLSNTVPHGRRTGRGPTDDLTNFATRHLRLIRTFLTGSANFHAHPIFTTAAAGAEDQEVRTGRRQPPAPFARVPAFFRAF